MAQYIQQWVLNSYNPFVINYCMKFNIAYPLQGTQKSFQIDDDNKCRIFFDKRLGQEVEADSLGDEFKGYVFKIAGGNDKDGFPMKQGVFTSGRVRLLLKEGSSCYRPRRSGERKRKSVRGCIVSSDIRALSLVLVKKGDAEIPGLTDVTKPRRLGPKRVTRIRKLYGLEKGENVEALVKKHAIRRTFQSKKTPAAHQRTKAPKIQRLVTDARLRRKKVIKKEKVDRWKKTLAAVAEYKKLYSEWAEKKRKEHHAKEKEAAEKLAEEKGGKKDVKKDVKKDAKKDDKAKKDVKADPKAAKTAKPATTKPAATTTTTTQKVETKTSATTKPAPVKKADSKPAETKKPEAPKVEAPKAPAPAPAATGDGSGAQVKATYTKVVKKPVQKAPSDKPQ